MNQLPPRLTFRDRLDAIRTRFGIGRMNCTVEPGLYTLGNPGADADVFVSANYKISFDCLRAALTGRNAWILVLDTKGINVWCAAGKGTFGTEELVHQIATTELSEKTTARRIIVPQLGAVGVDAHEVRKQTGFEVVYGPVRAEDLPAFLDADMQATPEMRRVTFPLGARLILAPMELVHFFMPVAGVAALIIVIHGLGSDGAMVAKMTKACPTVVMLMAIAYGCGTLLVPALLPWLPGRAFSLKGAVLGGIAAVIVLAGTGTTPLARAAWLILMTVISSFMAMNFTGCSTYTSLSGVKREMERAIPLQFVGVLVALVLMITAQYV